MKIDINQALEKATRKLKKTSETPRLDADILLAHTLKKTREYVLAYSKKILTKKELGKFESLVTRRAYFEPIAYIVGHKEFYGLRFKVTRDALIPRPETEMLVERSLLLLHNTLRNNIAVIDVGTGSGNIIISLADKIKNITKNKIKLFGTDISSSALKVARLNAKKNKVAPKIKFIESDLLNYFFKNKKGLLEIKNCELMIVSNLPYLSQKIYSKTLLDVKNFEPMSALLSGNHGLDHYENLLKQIGQLKKIYSLSHISCLFEISPEQKTRLQKIVKNYFPKAQLGFQKDMTGKWRIACFSL